jgi:hypothetical protein
MRKGVSLELPLLIAIGFALIWSTPRSIWRPYIVPDATEVYYATKNLVDQGVYRISVDGALHPPRYSYGYSVFFLAPVYWLTRRPEWMFAVPMACGIANMALVYALTRRLHGAGVGVLAALLAPGLPAYFLTSWDILSHVPSLTLFLLIALLVPAACLPQGPGILASIAIGLLCGVAITMRPTSILFLAPSLAVFFARFGVLRRAPWLRLAAMFAGAAPFLLPLFWSNLQTFGSWTRTGYSYWCGQIYDVPGKCFRYDFATLQEGLRYFSIPLALEPDVWRISALPLLVLVAGGGQILLGLIRAWRGASAEREFLIFTLATLVVSLGLYLPYTFRFYWFAYPAYVCLLPFLAGGLKSLWLGLDSGPWAGGRRVAGLLLVLLLCVAERAYFPLKPADPRFATGRQLRKLKQLLPEDAVFISNRDPLSVHEELERGSRRVCIPLHRGTEYAWTETTPRPPAAHTSAAITAASKPVFQRVFVEDPGAVLHGYPRRRVFLETTNAPAYTGPVPPEFSLVPVNTGGVVVLSEIKLR